MSTSTPISNPPDPGEPSVTPPYVFVITPFIIFILIAFLASILQIRRRNRLRAMGVWPPPEPYFGTPRAHDTVRTDGVLAPVIMVGGGWAERGRRGAGRNRRNADGSVTARVEEGLNELGEAPPPYDAKAYGKGSKNVELGELERGVGVDPPVYGAATANMGDRTLSSNNPYATLPREEAGEGSEIRAPAPAVTR